LYFTGQFLFAPGPNFTFIIGAKRNPDGYFSTSSYKENIIDSFYSLLKFKTIDEKFNLNCVAANLSITMSYIVVFPVRCEDPIANAYFCSRIYSQCKVSQKYKMIKNGAAQQVKN
jgi:hypothetical protein